jgi:hypothetical protein
MMSPMITDSPDERFIEPKGSFGPKLVAVACAVLVTALVLVGYTLLRKRHAEKAGLIIVSSPEFNTAPQGPPKALILVDEALLQGGKTIIGGTVRNTSAEKLEGLSVELELKRRKDGTVEKKLVALQPAVIEPQQEARYSLELKAQDYGSMRLVALKAGPDSHPLPYTTAQGQKRPPERLESRTITTEKRSSKQSEYLNSPDSPARVP